MQKRHLLPVMKASSELKAWEPSLKYAKWVNSFAIDKTWSFSNEEPSNPWSVVHFSIIRGGTLLSYNLHNCLHFGCFYINQTFFRRYGHSGGKRSLYAVSLVAMCSLAYIRTETDSSSNGDDVAGELRRSRG